MVIRTLANHSKPGDWLDYQQMVEHIKKDHNFFEVPKIHLDNAIQNLLDHDDIKMESHRLFIYQSIREKIQSSIDNFETLKNITSSNLLAKLKEKIPELNVQQEQIIIKNFHELIEKTLDVYGSVAAKLFADETRDIMQLKNYEGFQSLYQKKILQAVNNKFHKTLDTVFNEFFFKPSPELCKYFFASAQGYVLYEVLNLDPELRKMQSMSWNKKRIYLDTNVLLHLVCSGSLIHDSIHTLIKQTEKLGAQLFITEKTVDEFFHVLESFKGKLKHVRIKPKFSSTFEDSNNDNPLLLTYINEIQTNPDFSTESFIRTYENFTELIKNKFSISTEEVIESTTDNPNAETLKSHIHTRANGKSPRVVEHDLYNILRVRNLRKKGTSDEIGPHSWLITTDRSLFKAERDTFDSKEFTASITTEIWLQIISPFISPEIILKDTSFAFTQLLSLNFNSHKISPNSISTLMSLFIDDTKFTTEQFRKIIGDDYIQNHLVKIQEIIDEGKKIPEKQITEIMNRSLKIIENDFKQRQDESDNKHSKELEKMEKNINELRNEVSNLKKEKHQYVSTAEHKITELKFTVIFVLCAGVFTGLLVYGISLIPDFLYGAILTSIGVLVTEAGVYYLISKLTYKRKPNTKPWTRIEILTLSGIIITGITLAVIILTA